MSERHKIITSSEESLSIEKAVSRLKEALSAYNCKSALSDCLDQNLLVTFSQPVKPTEVTGWLCRQNVYPKLMWMNREKDFCVAGIGMADSVNFNGSGHNNASFQRFGLSIAGKNPNARYFGGFHFNNQEKQDPIWEKFSSFSFVLPLVQLTFEHNSFSLACHLRLESGINPETKISAILEVLDRVIADSDCSAMKLPELLDLSYNPDERNWVEQCQKALKTFNSGGMEKIMLARQTVLEFCSNFSPLLFLLQYPYPQNAVYRFYFEPAEQHAFFSFSPERLYKRDGDMLLTEALAGTCSKETINGGDAQASKTLLNSEKDVREHKFVRDMIYQELLKICSSIEMDKEVQVLQLNRLAHLYTSCTAKLKPEFQNDSAVLKRLHPTPAVGGVPKTEAMMHIIDLEPFSRGWYAGPVGWISRDAAEFSVAIRSALVNGRYAHLYSGAGLVKGSNPFSEWEEVEQKIGDILAITRLEV
ncbi:MAG: isochorismate synthase [Chlorobiaceae bacterium]